MTLKEQLLKDLESEDWYALSLQGLSRAYGDDEPDYELPQVKGVNPIDRTYPTTPELTGLAMESGSFDFLFHEPDLYSLEDGEPVAGS
jgi:hypothetical protein